MMDESCFFLVLDRIESPGQIFKSIKALLDPVNQIIKFINREQVNRSMNALLLLMVVRL